MALVRFDPFRELQELADGIFSRSGGFGSAMPVDAYELGDEFIIRLDIPGVDPESIDVNLAHDTLTISAERKWDADPDAHVILAERPMGKITKQLYLSERVDASKLSAHYDNGVLTITIPLAQDVKPRKIPVVKGNGAKALTKKSA